jgi:hypothetical protein
MSPTLTARAKQWLKAVASSQPEVNYAQLTFVQSAIIVRSKKLSLSGFLSADTIGEFLFDKTAKWIAAGTPLNHVLNALPEDIKGLGIMKMSEDPAEVREKMGV